MSTRIALKIDVDTYRGISDGAARLGRFLLSQKIPASFFVSLGPDNSGWAATRVFRHRGFLRKMQRTSAISLYGWRTALSGTLLPARPMGTSFRNELRALRDQGFEVSPHGYDHVVWHDQASHWNVSRAAIELEKIVDVYRSVFKADPTSFAAPGWQTGSGVWQAIDALKLLYHSDTRGDGPYWPQIGTARLKTLEIPTTLPTWDEMLAWDDVSLDTIIQTTHNALRSDQLNVWTLHAEVEGTAYFEKFKELILRLCAEGTEWMFLPQVAASLRDANVPASRILQGKRPGRAGTVTCQTV